MGVVYILCHCGMAHAQRVLTLDEAIATALQNNYNIQIAKNDSLVAAIDYSYRNAVFLPSVNAEATRTFNNNSQRQTLADGTERKSSHIPSNNLQASIGLDWILFDGLRMFATRDKAKVLLEAGSYTAKEQVINTVAQVVNTYYNIARQQQLVRATDVQIKLNKDRAKLAQYKLEIGSGAKPDVLQSKVDLNEQIALKMQQETLIGQLKEQLVQAMNSSVREHEFEVPDTIPLNKFIALGDIQDGIEKTNPTLSLARTNIDVAQYTLKETKAGLWPTISFGTAYNYNRTVNRRVLNNFSTLFNQLNGYNYGFTASVPIFNQFRVRRQIRQDKLNVNMQELNYDNQKSLVYLSVINAFKDYQQQQKLLRLEEESIQLAEENVGIVFETYKLGAATLVQLREAQLSLAMAYDRLIAARYNLKLSETELLRLKGDIVKSN
ncbi:TolC family protein [Niabella ginsengisoli]|uniref:TolC family protein n=1 Tax=Niabella ginsengisoli TaxID=522298 RepID=A0ABS9SJZ5_9BACT|nr:TolC family protein [Niabella ginsengisoli]MCH5598683.1 TolC family protein [Niabella ginsengisoli]